jgi:hypothetical protein
MLDLLRALTPSQRSAVGNAAIRDPNPPQVGVAFGHTMHTQRMSAARIIRSPAKATAFLIPQST